MPSTSVRATDQIVKEMLCDRLMLLQEATGLNRKQFAERVGLTKQQLSNIAIYRNPPSHAVIHKALLEFGVPPDYFYTGVKVGIRDENLVRLLRPTRLHAAA
jgi:transcriptional regulator with XRE-family HTH domain